MLSWIPINHPPGSAMVTKATTKKVKFGLVVE